MFKNTSIITLMLKSSFSRCFIQHERKGEILNAHIQLHFFNIGLVSVNRSRVTTAEVLCDH